MAVPTYEELLTQWKIDSTILEQVFNDNHFINFASKLDRWEMLAKSLRIPNSEIESIKDKGGLELQRIKMLECWKQRCGSKATYKAMIEALLQINRTDVAESIIAIFVQMRSAETEATTNEHVSNLGNIIIPPSPSVNSREVENTLAPDVVSPPVNVLPESIAPNEHVRSTLRELEEEFYDLVVFAEAALKTNEVQLDTIIRRFSMLPQSVRRQHETDVQYSSTRQRILNSTTIKELFDNLTDLRHWSYMTPETLAHILQDIKIDDMHQKVEQYTRKLATFKASTKLRDLIGTSFPVPDYCIELTMVTEGWEGKTILDAEKAAMNIIRQATHNGNNIPIGWKAVNPACIELVFILTKPITSEFYSMDHLHGICKDSGVRNLQIDDSVIYDHKYLKVIIVTPSFIPGLSNL